MLFPPINFVCFYVVLKSLAFGQNNGGLSVGSPSQKNGLTNAPDIGIMDSWSEKEIVETEKFNVRYSRMIK